MITVTQDNANNITERLKADELKKLRKLVLGYGNLKYNANKLGLPPQTLDRIVTKGSGLKRNITAIREILLGTGEKNPIAENADVLANAAQC